MTDIATEKRRASWRASSLKYLQTHPRPSRAVRTRKERQNRVNNPRAYKGYELKKSYGMTIEQFDVLATQQAGTCAVCGMIPKRLVVDHCHDTKVIRGLLCDGCNLTLGHVKDDPARLRKLADYVEKFNVAP